MAIGMLEDSDKATFNVLLNLSTMSRLVNQFKEALWHRLPPWSIDNRIPQRPLSSAALPTADGTPILLVDPMGPHRDFKIYVRNQSVWSIIIMYYYKHIGISGFDQATGGHLSLLQTYIDTIKRDKARKSGTFQRGLVLHLSQLQSMQLYRRFQIARRYSFP